MKYFVDTEFVEDGKTIDLISIGLVAEDGREFYACSREARLDLASAWVRENVLPSLPPYSSDLWRSRDSIANAVRNFVLHPPAYGPDPIKPVFWAYYADYDWVALCQLYGTMMQLPEGFPKFCMDLKQLSVEVGSPKHPPDPVGEHNALIDARWNRDLHKFLLEYRHNPAGGV
jgi:hypothetical protein